MTIIVQIGNSDNKLTQAEWSSFYNTVSITVENYADVIYFAGASLPNAPWQNAAFVFETKLGHELQERLKIIKHIFRQDTIAWTEGQTEMV